MVQLQHISYLLSNFYDSQVTSSHGEAEILRKENDTLKTSVADKEERAKAVLKTARQKIMQLTEAKNLLSRQLSEFKQSKGTIFTLISEQIFGIGIALKKSETQKHKRRSFTMPLLTPS
jgi:Tfp pilus assembly protein PilO